MHFPHFLNLIQVHNEAALVRMVLLDAFTAEYGQMVRAVEVLHSLVMLLANQAINTLLIFKIYVTKYWIAFYKLIQHVEI